MSALIFWQNLPSIHQAPLMRALATLWDGEILVVAEAGLSDERRAHGWYMPDFAPATLVVSADHSERDRIADAHATADCIHLFTGLHAFPETYRTFVRMQRTAATIGVFLEPGMTGDGWRPVLRKLLYVLQALRWRRAIDFLLVTGETGVRWYRGVGFPSSKIHPFGYFVAADVMSGTVEDAPAADGALRLLFVGQLIARKGVDELLRALALNSTRDWRLEVIGEGPERDALRSLATSLGLAGRIEWRPFAGNAEARACMAGADLLVLPSRFDGWGVVVNEALMAGTRVLVSDACGAADLIAHAGLGRRYACGSVTALAAALAAELERGRVTPQGRRLVRDWARRAIAPEVAADYLRDIVSHRRGLAERPVPPWRRTPLPGLIGAGGAADAI